MARPTPSQQRIIEALLKQFGPIIAKAFADAIAAANIRLNERALIEAIAQRDLDAAVELLRFDDAILFPLQDAIRAAYVAGGTSVGETVPKSIAAGWGFNGRHPRAERWIAQRGAELVQGIDQERQAARAVILAGQEEGRGAQSIARDITGRLNPITGRREGGIIGLTSEQTDYAISARGELTRLDPHYLTRKLRDTRYDPMVRKAIASGKPLSQADVDKITGRYKDRMLKRRGETISKTEAFTAQAAGRDEAYRQTLEKPGVEAVTVRWQHNLSEKPRPDHVAMNGTVIDMGQTFDFDDAQMRFPHDPAGGAKHSIGCRCIAVYRIRLKKG
jgi:hypothetical protein